jgi:class 3 adenylate cyclase
MLGVEPTMEPSVRYTTTSDGVAIAYADVGEGSPIVYMPSTPFSHVQLEWGIPRLRDLYNGLIAAGHRLVRYDARGTGLSDRDAADLGLEARLLDLEAVLQATGLERAALFATGDTGMEAISWAATRPERVTHLMLWCTWARRADVSSASTTRSLRALLDEDWTVYTETAARVLVGWANEADARHLAAFYRQCTSPEVLRVAVPLVYAWDVTPLLPQVRCPTLVMQANGLPYLPLEVGRALARSIPGAQLAALEGTSPLPFANDTPAVLRTIAEFLGDASAPVLAASPGAAPVTILFTDMEGSTAFTQRLGDARAQEVVRAHNRIVRESLAAHGGREIKHTGDGIMISFRSASQALECAIGIQRRVAELAVSDPEAAVRVRIGLNAGEPVAEEGDYFGTAVQLAARICAGAEPGQIIATGVVRDLVAGKGFLFRDLGETVPRGFEDTVRIFEAHW